MNNISLSGYLLIAGFVVVILATIVSPPRLYQESDSAVRLAIIETHLSRWVASNILFGLAGLATAGGLLLFSLQGPGEANSWLNWLAALSYGLGTVLWFVFLASRMVNPAQLFEDYTFSAGTIAMIGSLLVGLLLYGIVFLQAGFPGWLGFGTVGLTVLIGGVAVVVPGRFFAYFPPQIMYFFTLAAGIVMIRQ